MMIFRMKNKIKTSKLLMEENADNHQHNDENYDNNNNQTLPTTCTLEYSYMIFDMFAKARDDCAKKILLEFFMLFIL